MRESRWLNFLERAVLAMFVLTLVMFLVRVAGWRPGWWTVAWQVCSVVFILTLLMYLNAGGSKRVVKSKVGQTGLVLLGLAFAANLITSLFDIASSAWGVVRDALAIGFAVCFVTYVVIRIAQTRRSRDREHPTSSARSSPNSALGSG
ncbi:hypothetical protein [Actinocrispum sp. NPDC049592]|uniref:hypothetical protein n=1 Tax=Actinocrispum sp. NPDC049592 TaxID=3154835 RepID=UPI0034460782